eukprot:1547218-Prymnesium_polylepis.1
MARSTSPTAIEAAPRTILVTLLTRGPPVLRATCPATRTYSTCQAALRQTAARAGRHQICHESKSENSTTPER